MSRILVVEDIPKTREQLAKTLSEEFPDFEIDEATTADEALEKVTQAARESRPYGIGLFDVRLPKRQREAPAFQLQVHEAFREASPRGDVLYITAYAQEPQVRAHIERMRQTTGEPRPGIIRKGADIGWVDELLRTLRPMVDRLRRERIEATFNALFAYQESGASSPGGDDFRTKAGDREVGRELAAFKLDAETYWEVLPESLRQRIEEFFRKHETPEGGVKLVFEPMRLRGDG